MEKYTLQELKWIESALWHFTETHSQQAFVPFINEFPRDTELYKLMTTKPGES